MTREQHAELDAAVAREVLGIDPDHVKVVAGLCERWELGVGWYLFRPSSDIAHAFAVIEKVRGMGCQMEVLTVGAKQYAVEVFCAATRYHGSGGAGTFADLPAAICLVALRFVKGGRE